MQLRLNDSELLIQDTSITLADFGFKGWQTEACSEGMFRPGGWRCGH
jgi:hypothetical protein